MNRPTELASESQTQRSKLLNWVKANLYLSLANVLAALIALSATIGVIEDFLRADQLELGALALPFIAFLDLLFIGLVASLFIRKPRGYITLLGFISIIVVPIVGSTVVIGSLRSLSGVNDFPDEATSQSIEGIVNVVLALLYIWDIVNRIRKAKQSKAAS